MMAEERLKILQMLEEGKITAEEAAALLRALGSRKPGPTVSPPIGAGRFLRVRVADIGSGKNKVNVTIPLQLVKVGLRIAERFAPETEVDWQGLAEAITSGAAGKIVEIEDEEENERVEIYVE
ncbi:MAG: SHOCT-like domain-containing protein [Anaerolineae bacterium]